MWLLARLLLAAAAALVDRGSGVAASAAPSPAPSGAQCLGAVCYGLFWGAHSFAEAGDACEAGGGQLMTVRSTVAAEAVAVLLGGRAGGAWLGLRLPDGSSCVEPAKQLRGFLWVTGDEHTDYEAWANKSAAVCGPRCALVNERLSWEERACDADADGFFCEYSYPGGTCGPLRLQAPAAVSYLTPFGARESDLVAAPPGTAAEVASLNASLECRAHGGGSVRWGSASPGAWHCSLENGGCQHHCVPSEDAAICMCTEGYALGADGRSCLDVDDCAAKASPCEQKCVNTQGGFECSCYEGYELVEGRCLQKNRKCMDLMCEHECAEVNGEYVCICYEGNVPHPQQPNRCVLFCNQTTCLAECDPHTGETCYCADGFILQDEPDGTKVCIDIDECDSGCCQKLECINVPGSYMCLCPGGQLCKEPPDETEYSGEGEIYSTPSAPSFIPPKEEDAGRSQGVLIAIIVSTTLVVIVLVAALCYLVKKRCTLPTIMDYKCQQSETGVQLQQVVTPNSASS
ncbi:thrombomodulin [Lacerta agilis]|uniref:thrombomodulin n=1 Tax=Lacerta agilis TaxID=80427 RepID=UPI001419EE2B|nr:thrombomodulin [Lacerta agilis]